MSLIMAIILGAALTLFSAIVGLVVGLMFGSKYGQHIGKANACLDYARMVLDDDWPLLKEHMKLKEKYGSEWPTYIEEK